LYSSCTQAQVQVPNTTSINKLHQWLVTKAHAIAALILVIKAFVVFVRLVLGYCSPGGNPHVSSLELCRLKCD